jgi:PAS domain S-box-containing protein
MPGGWGVLYVGQPPPGVTTADSLAVEAVQSRAAALDRLEGEMVDCVVVDQSLPGEATGVELLGTVRDRYPELPVVLTTVEPDGRVASAATREGVTEYVARETDTDLATRVEAVVDRKRGAGDSDRAALDGTEPTAALASVHGATREMLAAESASAVYDLLVSAASSVLAFDHVGVHAYDPAQEVLRPVTWTPRLTAVVGRPPTFQRDEGLVWTAFETGEPRRYDDVREQRRVYDEGTAFRSELHLPVGEEGVLLVASTEADAFDDSDLQVARLLAASAAAAISGVERESDLRRYQTVVETVQEMVFVLDEDGAFSLVTQPMADWLGYSRDDLTGIRMLNLVETEAVDVVHDTLAALREAGHGDSRTIEVDIVTATGSARPAEVELASLPPDGPLSGAVGVVRDRTELTEARERLRDEQDRFSYLFENIPDAVVEIERVRGDPVVRSVNPAFAGLFDCDPEAMLDEPLETFVSPTVLEATGALGGAGDGVTQAQGELKRRTADGVRHFLYRVIPYQQESGGARGFVIYTDITEQRERQRHLKVLNRVLRHNLRNDLNVIMGLADRLGAATETPEADDLTDRLHDQARDVAALSEKALEIERAIGRRSATRSRVDAAATARSVVEAYRDRFPDATVRADVPEGLWVDADERLETVVDNLVENALVHATAPATVAVAAEREGDRALLHVRDDGPGIPANEREVVTGEREITQLDHGSGLGLWLVKWVTESYGGRVAFEESDLGGTEVTLSLPRAD